jgi:glycosyltransferase involved in cell wall biosynthesis
MNSQLSFDSIEVEFQVAKLWQQKGKFDRAITGYQKILAVDPTHWLSLLAIEELLMDRGDETTIIMLYRKAVQHQVLNDRVQQAKGRAEELQSITKISIQKSDFSTALAAYQRAIDLNPNDAELHKQYINIIVADKGIDAAFEYYELVRQDCKKIDVPASDLLCCVVVRNEVLRLPYFLKYYRQKGVAKFLIIDNQSTDETLSYLLQQPDVYVWASAKSFNQVNFGSVWFELLLRKYGVDRWCLTVDADELLYYPDCESKTIIQLCQELDQKHYRAYTAMLLDMYADRAIQDTYYQSGQNFLEVCPYFDRQYYHRKYEQSGAYGNQTIYVGGLRERIFGKNGNYLLSKVPLLKYGPEVVIVGGQHLTNLPASKIARGNGCLLHFKYFSIFPDYVAQEIQRKEHSDNAHQYSEYFKTLSSTADLKLYDESHSVRLQNSQQLVQAGILQVEPDDKPVFKLEIPQILQLPPQTHRPFWSVMITAYNRVNYLEQSLRSVLAQAPDAEEMQIEVVNDGAPASVQAEIAAIVDGVGQGRVSFYRHPENIGHPHIFNICIERAQGRWVHLLHDDDWVESGFYAALKSGIEQRPEVGAAFCRYQVIDEIWQEHWLSDLERSTPGILPNWLDRIAVACHIQFPAIAIEREVYETLGGFCDRANSTFDWEMWQRIAIRYPVWYEPQPLANFRSHAGAESHHLKQSGQQIADVRKAIEIAQNYLPSRTTKSFSSRALENQAGRALRMANQQLQRGDRSAAIANLSEALQCSQAPAILQALAQIFLEIKVEK